MSLFKAFAADPKLETDGRWFDIRPANPDGTLPGFLLARRSSRNVPYVKAMSKVQAARGDEIRDGTMDPAEATEINITVFVDTVLKGWRNVRNEDDKPLEYSRQNAVWLLTALPDLFARLNAESMRLSNYQDAEVEASGKN